MKVFSAGNDEMLRRHTEDREKIMRVRTPLSSSRQAADP